MGVAPCSGARSRRRGRDQGRRTVVLSHDYWQARFAGDPSIVGRTLEIDTFRGGAFTVSA